MQACAISEMFVEAMNARHQETSPSGAVRSFDVTAGRKYDRIISVTTYPDNGRRSESCHAFIDRTNGALIKAAGWKAPQKNSDGTPAIRFILSDEQAIADVVLNSDRFGSYLYQQ